MAEPLVHLAAISFQLQDYARAEALCLRSLTRCEKIWGGEHPDVAGISSLLGMVRLEQGELDQAEELLGRALSIREQTLGPEHPETAQTGELLAELACRRGRHAEAVRLLERSVRLHESVLGLEHPRLASTQRHLASVASATRPLHAEAQGSPVARSRAEPFDLLITVSHRGWWLCDGSPAGSNLRPLVIRRAAR